MFKRILVALDHSDSSDIIFKAALSLAQAYGSKLLLLHVLSPEEEGSPIPIPRGIDSMYWSSDNALDVETWRQQWLQYESDCLSLLQALAAEANNSDIEAEFRQISGSPGRGICHVARQWLADLIVIGNRGRSGLSEILLGSVSNYVLHHTVCDVLTIKVKPETEG